MPGGAHENMKAWEPEEDHIIMQMVLQEGPKWKLIVKQLPGRTVSSVRNRWQRIEKGRKLRDEGAELKNRCHACGEPKRGHICKKRSRGGPQVRAHGDRRRAPTAHTLSNAHRHKAHTCKRTPARPTRSHVVLQE